jgi:hypothetical protein
MPANSPASASANVPSATRASLFSIYEDHPVVQSRSIAARSLLLTLLIVFAMGTAPGVRAEDTPRPVIRSTASGAWSDRAIWDNNRLPEGGDTVLIREGHRVEYDVESDAVLRAVFISGSLSFVTDKSTQLETGLIVIRNGEDIAEHGIDCEAHIPELAPGQQRAALLVGTPATPVAASKQALIRLHYIPGMSKDLCPGIICCGGRMDFHGAPLNRTWVKFADSVDIGDTELSLEEPVTGWRPGDKVLIPSTERIFLFGEKMKVIPTVRDDTHSEERTITSVFQNKVTVDRPLRYEHKGPAEFRGEIANLSRNVIVESADPNGIRGHTMYHAHSAGSISYAEFRFLGKRDVLGRYSLHFHVCRDTMRGSSVVGASIHDSDNRWLTIHGTDFLIVRDCVGYNSIGHGFFLEDGTEVFNVLDRNLAVQARHGKALPKQVLPFDENEGAGFWWSNSLNSFTRNLAAECDQYGYRFEASQEPNFDLRLQVPQPDGSQKPVDIRTLPFVRFEDNEAHTQRRFAFNLGGIRHVSDEADHKLIREKGDLSRIQGGHVDGVGPDTKHPFLIQNFRVWNSHWVFHGGSPSVYVDGMRGVDCTYGIFKTRMDAHEYQNLNLQRIETAHIFQPWGSSSVDENYYRFLDVRHDDLPPTSVITRCEELDGGRLRVQGTTADNRRVRKVTVSGVEATALRRDFGEWEAIVPLRSNASEITLEAKAEDVAGNNEARPHRVAWFATHGLELRPPLASEQITGR